MVKLKISSHQKQLIYGKLLGDGHLETTNNITYRLKIEHSYVQKEYVDWLYKGIENLASNEPQEKTHLVKGKSYKKYWFNSHYSPSLRFYAQQFYQGKKKVVPKLVDRWLTPLVLAVWYMDDGSIKSKECRGRIINTQSFGDEDISRLRNSIQSKFGIDTIIRRQKEGKQIYIPAGEVEKFYQLIEKYVLPSMKYKLG